MVCRSVHVRRQLREGQRVAIVLWQFLNALVIDHQSRLRVVHSQQRRLRRHVDSLRLRAHAANDKVRTVARSTKRLQDPSWSM